MAIGWTMTFSGLKKHVLELKRRERTCPSCGRHISGAGLQRALSRAGEHPLARTLTAPRPLKGGFAARSSTRALQCTLARRRRLDERDVAELAARPRLLAVEVEMRSGDGEHVRGGRHRADQVDHHRRPARRSSRAAARGRRAGGSRTGSSRRPRSSSGRCCGRAARTRSRAGGRRRRRARARARRRSRARRAALAAYSSASACGALAAGARDVRRIPSSWTFSTSG